MTPDLRWAPRRELEWGCYLSSVLCPLSLYQTPDSVLCPSIRLQPWRQQDGWEGLIRKTMKIYLGLSLELRRTEEVGGGIFSTFYRTRVRSLGMLVSNWLTNCCLVNLIDVALACEDAHSKLVEVVTVAHVDAEDHVGNSLLQIWELTFGPKAKLLFRLWAQGWSRFWSWSSGKILKFVQHFAVDVLWRWGSSILVEILKLGLVKIFKLKFCLVEILKLMLGRDSEDVWSRFV